MRPFRPPPEPAFIRFRAEFMRKLPLAACILVSAFTSFAAPAAQTDAPSAAPSTTTEMPVGDPAKGRVLVYTCQGCHGITGYKNAYPSFRVPMIGGQSAQYLMQALNEYREGKRKHATMQAQAQSFSEQDIADIAAFLSSLKPEQHAP